MKSISLSLLFLLGLSGSAIAQSKMSWWEYTYRVDASSPIYTVGLFPTKESCQTTENWAKEQGYITYGCQISK